MSKKEVYYCLLVEGFFLSFVLFFHLQNYLPLYTWLIFGLGLPYFGSRVLPFSIYSSRKVFCITRIVSYGSYFIFLFLVLFFGREKLLEKTRDVTNLVLWLKRFWSDKVIFYNLMGNFFLMVPLGIFFCEISHKKLLAFLQCFILILCFEEIQYQTRLGVFDTTDILLNNLGSLLGIIFYRRKNYESFARPTKEKRREERGE